MNKRRFITGLALVTGLFSSAANCFVIDSQPLLAENEVDSVSIQNVSESSFEFTLTNGQSYQMAANSGIVFPCAEVAGLSLYGESGANLVPVKLQCRHAFVVTGSEE